MTQVSRQIRQNHSRIVERMRAACLRCNRPLSDVTLVAVTKYAEMNWVRALVELGVDDLGESRVQQLVQRAPQLPETVRWHLVGHLQRNKARQALQLAFCVHSVDSMRLLERLETLASESKLRPTVLLEVNISGESSKYGFSPDEVVTEWPRINRLTAVQVAGLMTMAPYADDVEQSRPVFRGLRELRDRLRASPPGRLELDQLSMGMSSDFEVAIEEGATIVRIGSSLFEGLSKDGQR